MTIKKWEDIRKDFTHALLLGNGASIQLWDDFSYGSLWLKAKSEGFITEEINNIARSLDTGTNFELLLRKLINARTINKIFKTFSGTFLLNATYMSETVPFRTGL